MLFSRSDDPQEDCKGMVQKYRECMKGYGFKI
jgi:cytochrome c oxidase assembly protein subunit 17